MIDRGSKGKIWALADLSVAMYTVKIKQYIGLQQSLLPPLLPKPIWWVFRTIIWRVSWTYMRTNLLTKILAGSISRLLLLVHTVPVPGPKYTSINRVYMGNF